MLLTPHEFILSLIHWPICPLVVVTAHVSTTDLFTSTDTAHYPADIT